ncbi:MAG: hypothetical protein GXO69_01875 [Acidobacteria bacterium]|nr:hypothetical protein [Acidobacteriota bacterium]
MITESRSKVKTILVDLVISEKNVLKQPDAKFLIEGTIGVMVSGTYAEAITAKDKKPGKPGYS